jgi:hypothetical protein
MRKINSVRYGVEGAAVDISCLHAHDQWVAADFRQHVGKSVESDPTLIIGRNYDAPGLAQPQKPQCTSTVSCRSSPTITAKSGAPRNPSRSTFQPARRNTS